MLVRQRISQIPTHRRHDHVTWILSLERIGSSDRHGLLPYQILSSKLRNETPVESCVSSFYGFRVPTRRDLRAATAIP
jgi:hypothetical protein